MLSAVTVTAIITFVAMLIMLPVPTNSQSFGSLTTTTTTTATNRRAAYGDFDEFNKIFDNAYILIPEEFKVSERVAFVDLNLNLRNIKCYDMNVGDIMVEHEQKFDDEFLVTVDVKSIDLTCEIGMYCCVCVCVCVCVFMYHISQKIQSN
jgi:hypothetical protein